MAGADFADGKLGQRSDSGVVTAGLSPICIKIKGGGGVCVEVRVKKLK